MRAAGSMILRIEQGNIRLEPSALFERGLERLFIFDSGLGASDAFGGVRAVRSDVTGPY